MRRYAVLVGWRESEDDGISDSRQFDVQARSAALAIQEAICLADRHAGREIASVAVLTPAEEEELADFST